MPGRQLRRSSPVLTRSMTLTSRVMRESSWREQEALETRLRQTEQDRTSLLASQSSLRASLQQHQAVMEEKDVQHEKESGHLSSLEVGIRILESSGEEQTFNQLVCKDMCTGLKILPEQD